MQKYQPRIHVEEIKEGSNSIVHKHVTSFPQTAFIAVTAYQNQEVSHPIEFVGPAYWGLNKQMGCLCLQGKLILNGNLVIRSGLSLPRKSGSSQTIHTYRPYWLSWMVIFEALFGSHDILSLGQSPIKWSQRPNMTLAVDSDINHLFKQTKPFNSPGPEG